MALELYYTSSPRGLRPGTSGLCTVATTRSMSAALVSRLESLCGYRPPGEGIPIDRWPAALSHWVIDVGGVERHVLAAVRPVKPDHTMRSNTLAHFAVLHPSELDAAGAAWMLAQPETSASAWSGEPRMLDTERAMPRGGPSGARACVTWKSVAGDAGWAGVLANAAMLDPTKPSTVIYPTGVRALDLVAEAMALLPAAYRWRVTFTTYFTQPIAGVRCTWRFCLDGTSAATAARQSGGLVIDASAPHPCTRTGEFVEAARAGREPVLAAPSGQSHVTSKVPPDRAAQAGFAPIAFEPEPSGAGEVRRRVPARQPVGVDEIVPSAAPGGRTGLAVAAVTAVALLAIVAVLAVIMRTMSVEAAELEARAARLEQERDALQQSGGEAEGLRAERDRLQSELGSMTEKHDALDREKRAAEAAIAALTARLKVLEPAEGPPTPRGGKPPQSPPVTEPPAPADPDEPQARDVAPAGAGDGPSATGVPAGQMIRQQRATRQEVVTSTTPVMPEDVVGPVEAPSVVATQDSTATLSWPTVQACAVDTVTLVPSSALMTLGFTLRDGDRLAFAASDGIVDVARAGIDGGSVTWTWMSGGTGRVKSWLDAQQLTGPEGWSVILGQVRLHAMCSDGLERSALMASPRVMSWKAGARGTDRLTVEIPAVFAEAPSIEWMGSVIDIRSDAPTSLGSAQGSGTVTARLAASRPSDTKARVTLEWGPSDHERASIECIRTLEVSIAKERELTTQWSRVSQWHERLASQSRVTRSSGQDLAAAEAGLKAWQAEKAANLDLAKRETFEAQPLDKRVREYASWIWESKLKPARDDLATQHAQCDRTVSQWQSSVTSHPVLLRPDRDSPPLVRIVPDMSRKVPGLPFAPSGTPVGTAP